MEEIPFAGALKGSGILTGMVQWEKHSSCVCREWEWDGVAIHSRNNRSEKHLLPLGNVDYLQLPLPEDKNWGIITSKAEQVG